MELIKYSLALILFFAYSIIEGKREAYYYHNSNLLQGKGVKENIHSLFFIQRAIFTTSLLFICNNPKSALTMLVSFILIFSYFHNGMYYLTRNKLDKDIYTKKWSDESTSSTAKIEINYKQRTISLIIGLLLYSLLYFNF